MRVARLFATLLLTCPALARADKFVVAEAPAAVAVSDVQASVFRPGAMPAVGAYAGTSWLALGLRLRAGVLSNGPAPRANVRDPRLGGLGEVGLAVRLSLGGAWAEIVGGGGVTGRDLAPVIEAGIGWNLVVGDLGLGPGLRVMRVESTDPMDEFGSAELILVGLDAKFGPGRPKRRTPRSIAPARMSVAVAESDRDRITDVDASCAQDDVGCTPNESIVVKDDRIVLSERVLFDFDRADVKYSGRLLLAQLVELWRAHPDWRRMAIEGHADSRGGGYYNLVLSKRRAASVVEVLTGMGISPDRLDAAGYGKRRPEDRGDDEHAHQRNRRVEFVIEREGGEP